MITGITHHKDVTVTVTPPPPPPPQPDVTVTMPMDTARVLSRILGRISGSGDNRRRMDTLCWALRSAAGIDPIAEHLCEGTIDLR